MDSGPHPAAALTDALVSALNNNLLFREISPFASQVEELLIGDFAGRLGLPPGSAGTFCSGGSIANLTALFAACGGFAAAEDRSAIAVFVPASVHASVTKSAAVLGIPKANIKVIPGIRPAAWYWQNWQRLCRIAPPAGVSSSPYAAAR